MGNCFSQLKKTNKVFPEGKPKTSSPAKSKSRRPSFFWRKNTNNGTNNSKCQVEVPAACQLTASKHEVDTNTTDEPKERPLSTSTFIVPYENSILRRDQRRELSASKASVESSSTLWPKTDASSQGTLNSSILSYDEVDKPEPTEETADEESCEPDEDDDQSCARVTRNVIVHKQQRPKKNIWRMPVYTDPLIVGDNEKPKTALETWIAEVDQLLLGDACEADLLLYDLDHVIMAGSQDRATYRCELPRPKTRRGRATDPSQVDTTHNIKDLQPAEGGNKQKQVSTDPGRDVLDKSTAVAVKKCVRFVDVPAVIPSLAEDLRDPDQGCLDERITAPEDVVYDEEELVLIDEIEKEFGIT